VNTLSSILTPAIVLAACTSAWAMEWHVNPQGTGDAPTIQAAFDAASAGDRIILAPGLYRDSHTRQVLDWFSMQTTTAIAFMKPGVDLIGSDGPEATVLDGEDHHHCLVGADLGPIEVRGITFFDGRTIGSDELTKVGGAGMIVFRSQPTVENCVFKSCLAPTFQGDGASGLYIIQGSGASVRFNLFVDNYGGDIGGAAGILQHSIALVANNTFVRNACGDGGGAIEINQSHVQFQNNIFASNTAGYSAGAILCLNGAVATGNCNLFWQNEAPVEDDMTVGCQFIGVSNNIIADPFFCNADLDNFTIQSNSPAAPNDPSGCGLRGALPVGCGIVSVEPTSWGQIKSKYHTD
jgi:serine protease